MTRFARLNNVNHIRIGLAALVAAMAVACDRSPAFSESGVGNGSSAPFHLASGAHRIAYEAHDREPFFGCIFGVSLGSPNLDPPAPNRAVAQTEIRRVEPRGRISGTVVTPHLLEGQYALHYLGDEPCDWTVTVS